MSDVQGIINRIMADERFRRSSHFSDRVYADEPILTTGRQMASYLPDRYREMRAISRWQPGADGAHGRWLSEAELFYRQGVFMEDFEDDCPYHGSFKSYYPTYNAMSDRQLRGYFTWRAAVRRGEVEETSLSFAYVYIYELLCGIGVEEPAEGFAKLRAFWQAYRAFAPELDRYLRVWLQDYVVYHGLDPHLLDDQKNATFDRMLIDLQRAQSDALARLAAGAARPGRRQASKGALLPPDPALEARVLAAVDALSTYRIGGSRFYRERPEAVAHVACAVFARLCEYYAKHRKSGLIESLFGELSELPYTMFASAVFYSDERHPDTVYELNGIHRFRCTGGLWTCERVHGSRARSPKLGEAMRAVDRLMRAAYGYGAPLKDEKIPKYLEQIIEREIAAWRAWEQAHAPRRIDIDLSKLSGIRSAAAETREALLIDEEREEEPDAAMRAGANALVPVDADGAPGFENAGGTGVATEPDAVRAAAPDPGTAPSADPAAPASPTPVPPSPAPAPVTERAPQRAADSSPAPDPANKAVKAPAPASASAPAGPAPGAGSLLSPEQAGYLSALLSGDAAARRRALQRTSEDLLVDAVNEALFDEIGDTVIEFGADGPELVDDYREDIERLLDHG